MSPDPGQYDASLRPFGAEAHTFTMGKPKRSMASPKTLTPVAGVYYSRKNDSFLRLRVAAVGQEVEQETSPPGRMLFPPWKGDSPEPGDY